MIVLSVDPAIRRSRCRRCNGRRCVVEVKQNVGGTDYFMPTALCADCLEDLLLRLARSVCRTLEDAERQRTRPA